MLMLPDVTLCCVDTANHALAVRALNESRREVHFARTLLLTHLLPNATAANAAGIEVVPIAPITSRDGYSDFVLKSLLPYITTSHALLVQWDGYVINPAAWDPAFLECDYIGAKWFWHDDGMRVGNGGFSLRSRRLLEALQDPRIMRIDNEDTTIGRSFRPLLEREHGIRFATDEVADRFSFEAAYPIGKPFGFHGLYNFCRVVPEPELAALAPQISDAIARSLQLGQLVRNCIALGRLNIILQRRKRSQDRDGCVKSKWLTIPPLCAASRIVASWVSPPYLRGTNCIVICRNSCQSCEVLVFGEYNLLAEGKIERIIRSIP